MYKYLLQFHAIYYFSIDSRQCIIFLDLFDGVGFNTTRLSYKTQKYTYSTKDWRSFQK